MIYDLSGEPDDDEDEEETPNHSLTHTLTHSLSQSPPHSLTHSPPHSPPHSTFSFSWSQSSSNSLSHSLAHSPTHSFTHSFTHSPTHSLSSSSYSQPSPTPPPAKRKKNPKVNSPCLTGSQREHDTVVSDTVRDKARDKEREKEARARVREREKQARARVKESIQQAKKESQKIELQKHGFYKTQEISLVLPEDVHNSPLKGAIESHLMFTTDSDKCYGHFTAPSTIPGLYRWTYRNFLNGGKANVGEPGVVVIPFVVVVFSPRLFMELVEASPDGVEFPLLEQEMLRLRESLESNMCRADSKIVLLLIDIDEECKQYKKDQRRSPKLRSNFPVRQVEWHLKIEEAVAYLLYNANIDVVMRSQSGTEFKQVAKYFETVTRCIGDQAARQRERSCLDNIKKISTKKPDGYGSDFGVGNSNVLSEDRQLREIFSCMLQVVPGMSRTKAEHLIKHYPYPQQLMAALSNPQIPEKDRMKLLANKLDTKKNNVKLAAQLYKVFTSLNPEESL